MPEIDPKLKNDFSIAEKFYSEGKYLESIKKYQAILIDYPKLIAAINNIGQSYEQLDQLDESIKYFEKCLLIDPSMKTVINNIVTIFIKKKDYNKVITYSTKSLIIDESQINMIEIKTKCLIKLNLINEAKLFLHPYIIKYPNNNMLSALMGKILIALNEHQDGLEALKKGTGFIELEEDKVRIVK